MARLSKVVRQNPISQFQRAPLPGGAGFAVLADAMNQAYEFLEPIAIERAKASGSEQGRTAADSRFGDGLVERTANATPGLPQQGTGDGFDFSPYAIGGATRPDSFSSMTPGMRAGLASLLQASEAELGPGLQVYSGFRSNDLQASLFANAVKKYGSEAAARKWVAPPGRSRHNTGQAADLKFNGVRIDKAPKHVADWIRNNSPKHGLNVRMSWEPWQVEEGTGNAPPPTVAPEVTIRKADGSLQPRLYSPASGPILQAHNAAAGVAYQSETINRAQIDLLDISQSYLMDPEGFAETAGEYIDELVQNAPDQFREDVRNVLSQEVQRRTLGIMEDRQSDIRRRANNSSAALVDRYTDTYADALAAGNPEDIEIARQNLSGVLQAREALPGVGWTEQQSANVLFKAQDRAEAIRQRAEKNMSDEVKDALDLIIKSAKDGRVAADETTLEDPSLLAMHPELGREALAFSRLRDNMPDFLQMTPAQQLEAIGKLEDTPVEEEWQLDIADAAKTAARENRKAWRDDPIARAQEVLNTKPPALPDFTTGDPNAFVSGLRARVDYAEGLADQGYTDTVAYFSKAEAESLSLTLGADVPAEIRAAAVGAIVSAAGPSAVRMLDELDGDEGLMFAGKMMAIGGKPDVAADVLRGQAMIDEGLVELPPKSDRIASFDADLGEAFSGLPGAIDAQSEVMKAATALYATQARGVEPGSEAASALMSQSIQRALGQSTNKRGELVGGVQSVFGRPTLLPVGVNGEDASVAVRLALGGIRQGSGLIGQIASGINSAGEEVPETPWADLGMDEPQLNGKPLDASTVNRERVRMVPLGGPNYRLEVVSGTSVQDVSDSAGNVFVFNLPSLMELYE